MQYTLLLGIATSTSIINFFSDDSQLERVSEKVAEDFVGDVDIRDIEIVVVDGSRIMGA
jgi:hypothetical protein